MKTPSLRASLMCEDFAMKSDGSLVLFGIFWVVQAYRVPASYGPVLMVNMWTNGQGEYEEEIELLPPDRSVVLAKIGPNLLRLHSVDQVVPSVFRVVLPVREFGTNWVRVRLDGRAVLEYPLSVVPIVLERQRIEEEDLVQGSGPEVYVVKGGKRRHVPDPYTFDQIGYDWNAIKRVPDEQLEEIPVGKQLPRRRLPGPHP